MSLISILHQRLTEQFTNAQLEGASHLSPRNGYYFIKEVNYNDFPKKGKIPVATVLWKLKEIDSFNKDVSFLIALSALSIGDPLDYLNMANKTIRIYDSNLVEDREHVNTMKVACKYEILSQKPKFTTAQSQVITCFAGNASTIAEAYINYEKTLGITLAEALEAEAYKDDAYDAPDQEDTNSNA